MTANEKKQPNVDYMYPIILLGWGITFLFGSVLLLCLFVASPSNPYDWRLWFSIILGLIVGIWWTKSGIQQSFVLLRERARR